MNNKPRTAIAFQSGNKFMFPDDPSIYEFGSIGFESGEPVITYLDSESKQHTRKGFSLFDLLRPDSAVNRQPD